MANYFIGPKMRTMASVSSFLEPFVPFVPFVPTQYWVLCSIF